MDPEDSDYIDSETEAYLYSQIYHEFQSSPADVAHKIGEVNDISANHLATSVPQLTNNATETNRNQVTISSGVSESNRKSNTHIWSTAFLSGQLFKPQEKCIQESATHFSSVYIKNQRMRPTVKVSCDVDLQAERHNRKVTFAGEMAVPSKRILSKRQKLMKSNREVLQIDSSSDSSDAVIKQWPECGEKKVVINLDSSTDSSCVILDNENDVREEEDQSLWQIIREDMVKDRPKSRLSYVTCYNCKERGHLSKYCNQPKRMEMCYLCGAPGHRGEWCSNPLCSKCLLPGHWQHQCLWSFKAPPCALCHTKGHLCQECPSIWRRYHLTTAPGPLVTASEYSNKFRSKNAYCYSCGGEGHYGYECTRKRKDVFPVCRLVTDYSDPQRVIFSKENSKLWGRKLWCAARSRKAAEEACAGGNLSKKVKYDKKFERKRRFQNKQSELTRDAVHNSTKGCWIPFQQWKKTHKVVKTRKKLQQLMSNSTEKQVFVNKKTLRRKMNKMRNKILKAEALLKKNLT